MSGRKAGGMAGARTERVVVIGAGMAGLAVALELAQQGLAVTVVERAAAPGGKLRELALGPARIDGGPTVFTMRWVFEELFATVGTALDAELTLVPAEVLARHAWDAATRLDLFADQARSAAAIAAFAGPAEGRRLLAFCARARQVYRTLEAPFIRAASPSPASLVRRAGLRGLGDLWRIAPFATLWQALGEHFEDPRLRQLFGRYATYCGGSPFLAPATLMLIAHVEQYGVWLIEGGMHRLATTLARLAAARGARIRYGCTAAEILVERGRASGVRLADGERIAADAVVLNADIAALAGGRFGHAATGGFPLHRHNVFFAHDYAAEFADIFECGRLPQDPTVYVCAQDRGAGATPGPAPARERLLCLVNAPPCCDAHPFEPEDMAPCEERTFALLARCGLTIDRTTALQAVTTPADFEALFPATGGALYGQAPHGWRSAFSRPTARSRLPGLYLAGGSVHPGPGLPMAVLSGQMAAASLLADLASSGRFRRTAMPGGMSTP